MVTCNLVVKRFEPGRKWYIGSVKEMYYMETYNKDTSPKLEQQYTISFTVDGDSLYEALNNILSVKFWGAVMYDRIDKISHPLAMPACFWERKTKSAPRREDCVNEFHSVVKSKTFIEKIETENLYFILWDTRESGSEEPGVHVPQDNIFSGRIHGSDKEKGDRPPSVEAHMSDLLTQLHQCI
jgi:hypothetical protein